jgi:hypothetical protein
MSNWFRLCYNFRLRWWLLQRYYGSICNFRVDYSGSPITANSDAATLGNASVALSGTLDRVRITTVNGTDTFDAGTINILYE